MNKRLFHILCGLAVGLGLTACSSNYVPMISSAPSHNYHTYQDEVKPKSTSSYKKTSKKEVASPQRQEYSGKRKVVVKKGDTIYSLAKSTGVSVRAVIEANNLKSPYTLSIGQDLWLPVSKYYTVVKGDTIYSISRKFSVDMRALVKVNKLAAPYAISPGQKLCLPETLSGVQTAAKTTGAQSASPVASAPKQPKFVRANGRLSEPKARSSERFAWPCKGVVVVPFGNLGKGRYNDGINIKASKGDDVVAAENGVIAYAGDEIKGFGNLVLIKHADGWMTGYAHLSKIKVKKNEHVKKRQKIGEVGATGRVSLPQVHFEVRLGRKAKDPLLYLENK